MRVLKVRSRNCDFEGNGAIKLKKVMRNRFIKGNYTHVQIDGDIVKCEVIDAVSGSKGISQYSNVWVY